jgi:hypothetical protein
MKALAPTGALLAIGALGCPLFVLTFFVEGLIRADYDPQRYPISSLAIGEFGWIQSANFLVVGVCFVALAIGARRVGAGTWGPGMIGLAGLGLLGAGVFTTDPVFGYPPNLPLVLAQYTIHGHLHDLFSMFFFVGVPGACFVFSRRFFASGRRAWAAYSMLSGIGMLVACVLTSMGFLQNPNFTPIAGVLQRLTIIIGMTWVTLLALTLRSRGERPTGCVWSLGEDGLKRVRRAQSDRNAGRSGDARAPFRHAR